MSFAEHDAKEPQTVKLTVRQPKKRRLLGSLRWRLSLWYVGVVAILLMALGLTLVIAVSHLLYTNAFQTFTGSARALASIHRGPYMSAQSHQDANTAWTCTPYPLSFETNVSQPMLESQPSDDAVFLIDPATGSILAPAANAGVMPPKLDLNKLHSWYESESRNWQSAITASRSTEYLITTQSGNPGAVVLIAYSYRVPGPCPNTGRLQPAVVMVIHDFVATKETVRQFEVLLIISLGVLLLLGLLIGVPLTGATLRGLERVSTTAKKLAAGDLSQRVNMETREDEIGDLAQTFDEMATRLELYFREQQESEQRVRQFLADASHELRTPITSIRGYLDILSRFGDDDPVERGHILQSARRESERMSRLVNDLLTLARFDMNPVLELASADLIALAGEAIDQARLLAGNREVSLQTDGYGPLWIRVDSDRIKQVLLVLLDNALKYGRQDELAWVRVSVRRTMNDATIVVTDNGPGIPLDDLPHIFERFYRGEKRKGDTGNMTMFPKPSGTGLGLPIARAIVQAHGGHISVSSMPGKGTEFVVQIPLVQQRSVA
jgi:two-component system, OmpR family, sensor kinase